MAVTRTHPSALTAVKAGIAVASGTALTFYYDQGIWTATPRVSERRWEKLYNWSIYEGIIRFPYDLPADRALRLIGRRPLTTVTLDTDTVEIDEPQIEILYASAIVGLYRKLSNEQSGKRANAYDDEIAKWEYELATARRRYSMSRRITGTVDSYWR